MLHLTCFLPRKVDKLRVSERANPAVSRPSIQALHIPDPIIDTIAINVCRALAVGTFKTWRNGIMHDATGFIHDRLFGSYLWPRASADASQEKSGDVSH